MTGILIIGAGHGGTQLAASLRKHGYGSAITLVSEDPELPYHKPPLSKSFMQSSDQKIQPLRVEAFFESNDIELRMGEIATGIDRVAKRVTFKNGKSLAYDQLVLATGTEARKLNCRGHDLDGVFSIRTAANSRAIRERLDHTTDVVIIGGGFIGLESAAMLVKQGHCVTVLELAPNVLGRAVSTEIAEAVTCELQQTGVDIRCSLGVDHIAGEDGCVTHVVTTSGEHIAAQLVIVGIGAIPCTSLAETAQLEIENGICVDGNLKTSSSDIYAIGDCGSFPQVQLGQRIRLESIQNATEQADHLAIVLTGGATNQYARLPWFWSDIGVMKLQIAGLRNGEIEKVVVHRDDRLAAVYHYSANKLVSVETINGAGEHMLARKMITEGFSPSKDALALTNLASIKESFKQWKTRISTLSASL